MHKAVAVICALTFSGASFGAGDSIWAEGMHVAKPPFQWRRLHMIRPASMTLREDNITDEEVREIQSVMKEVAADAIVHIGGVMTGCNCEEGPDCTDQVWVIAYKPERSDGFTLSRIKGEWSLGVLPKWTLENLRLEGAYASTKDPAKRRALAETWVAHQNNFPVCHAQPGVPADAPRSASARR